MKLLGRDISGAALLEELEARLRARGLTESAEASGSTAHAEGVAPPVDPLRFNLRALEEHADPTRPVPLHTHRGGLTGRLLLLSKRLAQRGGRVLLASALERQRVFNGHVRDSYAQLSADVLRLTAQVERLNAQVGAALAEDRPAARSNTPGAKDALHSRAASTKAALPGGAPTKKKRGPGAKKPVPGASAKKVPRGDSSSKKSPGGDSSSKKSPRGSPAPVKAPPQHRR